MAFRFEKLTVKSQEAVAAAQSLAQSEGHAELDSLHVLSALLSDNEGVVVPLLKKIGTNVDQLKSMCQSEWGDCLKSRADALLELIRLSTRPWKRLQKWLTK